MMNRVEQLLNNKKGGVACHDPQKNDLTNEVKP